MISGCKTIINIIKTIPIMNFIKIKKIFILTKYHRDNLISLNEDRKSKDKFENTQNDLDALLAEEEIDQKQHTNQKLIGNNDFIFAWVTVKVLYYLIYG